MSIELFVYSNENINCCEFRFTLPRNKREEAINLKRSYEADGYRVAVAQADPRTGRVYAPAWAGR